MTFELSGSLANFHLIDILQLLIMSQKCGALCLMNEQREETGELYLDNGILLHARFMESRGMTACDKILNLENGFFLFASDRLPPETTIGRPANIVLLDFQTRRDELAALNRELPAASTVLTFVPELEAVPAFTTLEWRVLSYINGRRSLERICQKTGDELSTKRVIKDLLRKNVIQALPSRSDGGELVPHLLPAAVAPPERQYPSLLRTNLVLKTIDGQASIRELARRIGVRESEVLRDIKLLYESHWVRFSEEDERKLLFLKNEEV